MHQGGQRVPGKKSGGVVEHDSSWSGRLSSLRSSAALSIAVLATLSAAATGPQTPDRGRSADNGAISGAVVDGRTGLPIPHALVRLTGGSSAKQEADSRGRFVFLDLPRDGSYTVSAEKPGYLSEIRAGGSVGRHIDLSEQTWVSDTSILLWPSASIGGTVTDEQGEPVCGAFVRVLLEVLVNGQPRLATGPIAKTDDRGHYQVASLAKGKYMVSVPSVQATLLADPTPNAGTVTKPALSAGPTTSTRSPHRQRRDASPGSWRLRDTAGTPSRAAVGVPSSLLPGCSLARGSLPNHGRLRRPSGRLQPPVTACSRLPGFWDG